MLPSVWGSNTWYLLHILSLFPKRRQDLYRTFFHHLQYLLPCAKCRYAYKEHIIAIPFPKKKEENGVWLIRVHNRVNKSIDKPVLDEQEMLSHWEREYIQLHTIQDTRVLEAFPYFLEDHPGSRSIEPEVIDAHLFFWNHIVAFLPSKLDLLQLRTYIEEHPISREIIRSKTKYRKWFEKLQKRLHMNTSILDKECTDYCRV